MINRCRNSTQLSYYYDIKESPKAFRYADNVFEHRQRLMKNNNICDTAPTEYHEFVFGKELRAVSR